MAQKRVVSAVVVAFVLLASTRFVRAQDAARAVTPVDGPQSPVVEPLPEIAPPAAPPPARPLLALSRQEPRMIHEESSGLKLAGELTFWTSYSLALLGSLVVWTTHLGLDSDPDSGPCRTCNVAALSLAIPVVGPMIVYAEVPKNEAFQRNPWPLLLPLGIWSAVEAAGVVMWVAGWSGHDVPEEPAVTVRHRKISVVPSVTSDGGMLALRTPW
jgi:hypothetical protein